MDRKRVMRSVLLVFCALVLMGSKPGSPAWRMQAD